MMKTIYILIGIALCSYLFFSCKKDTLEPKTVLQVSVPSQDDLNRILFINDTLGFIAGGDKYYTSDLLMTRDGGKTWTLTHFSGADSKAVYGLATNGTNIYGVGFDGKIYIKSDAGPADWQRIQSPVWDWLQAIAFTGPDKGFIIAGDGYRAGRIYRTDHNANLSLIDTFEYQLADIQFADTRTGYTCGYGAVLKTADGGDSWQLQDTKGDFFRSISCVGTDQVWIAGYNGTIVHTADAGKNWERQRNGDNPLLKKYRFRSILFRDALTGYAAGDKGLLLKTRDGGKHWSEFEPLTDKDLRCITFHPDGSLWIVGTGGAVLHIKD